MGIYGAMRIMDICLLGFFAAIKMFIYHYRIKEQRKVKRRGCCYLGRFDF